MKINKEKIKDMAQYIDKAVVMAEIRGILHNAENFLKYHHDESDRLVYSFKHQKLTMCELLTFIDSLEVKEMGMPTLDNGNMPIKRWKEACKAASCQANYRKSKGLTETCDDYFVDGVQWADNHPNATEQHLKVKEVDLEKELDRYTNSAEYVYNETRDSYFLVAKHFFELGIRSKATKASEFLKKHFEETPQEELDKEWKEIEPLNDIGTDVLGYANKISKT